VLTIVRDAARFAGPVVLAGDFNSEGIGRVLVTQGYHWVSSRLGPTISFFSWDHIFVRGLVPQRAGVVRQVRGASDHKPVWAVARTDSPVASHSEPSSSSRAKRGIGPPDISGTKQ
jgi:endonuclease/exonuclease/phosphatase (EEP) superfamily protein YafD